MDEIKGDFIAGFVEGEGCFSLNYNKVKSSKNKKIKYLRPMFSLGLNKRDKKLLEKIKQIIGCGRIYQDNDIFSYRIYRKSDLQNILIPFFEKYPFHGSKKVAFEIFKEIIFIVSKRKHAIRNNDESELLELKTRLKNYDDKL